MEPVVQAPWREPGHTVAPFEVVIEIVVGSAAWAAGTVPKTDMGPKTSSETTAAVQRNSRLPLKVRISFA